VDSCPRCRGFIIEEIALDPLSACRRVVMWRCVICGNRIDQVITVNRTRSEAWITLP